MDRELSTSTVNIKAKGGSLVSGTNTVTIDQPQGIQLPEVTMSGDYRRQPSFNANIEVSESNVSVAYQTAVLVNIRPSEEAPSPTTDNVLPTDQSTLPSLMNVTGGEASGDTNLHFFVHEQGKYIQIGQCCVIVEMHVNNQTMERLKAQGTLEVESQIGASLVSMKWRGIGVDEAELRTKIKVQLTSSQTESLNDLERKVLQELVTKQCEKCQQLVSFLLKEFRGNLTEVSLGCIQLTLFFSNREDFQRGRSSEAILKIQKFLDGLLLTDRGNRGFRVTVLEEDSEESSPMDTTLYNRVQGKTEVSGILTGIGTLASGQSGEIMTQDQFTRQISLQVKQSITEELELFRMEQAQILRDAMKEVLPEMEQRILENISTKLDVGKETPPLKSDSGFEKPSPDIPMRAVHQGYIAVHPESMLMSPEIRTPSCPTPFTMSTQIPVTSILPRSRTFKEPMLSEELYDKPDTQGRKQTTGVLPVKPSEGKKLIYTKKSGSGSWKQTPGLSIRPTWSGESHSESGDDLSGDDEISDLVKHVQSKVKKCNPKVKVKQRSQPLDFSHLFNAIHGRRTEKGMEKFEGCLGPEVADLHEYLKEILGEESLRVVQQASDIADKVTCTLDDAEISEKFCTVLCVDLSHSMAGKPIKDQAAIGKKIIKDCLGHICLVSIGSETKVVQEITKDRDTASKVMGQLQIEPFGHGSSSPMLQGLFTALKLLQGRVKPTDYGLHHTMYPKIVIISDGFFNDCSPGLEGKQLCQKTDELLTLVLEVLVAMDIRIPIYFVPVAKKENVTHGWFSKLSVVDDADVLSDSEVKEMSIGKAMEAIMLPHQPEAPSKSWEAVKKEFTQNHTATMLKQIEWFITESFKHPPPVGTRVWVEKFKFANTGTLFCHINEGKDGQSEEVLIVQDSTGHVFTYDWSFHQENILFYEPPNVYHISEFPVGSLVRKGGEKTYDDLGVVFDSQTTELHSMDEWIPSEETVLQVSWRSGGVSNVHNELELNHAESPLLDLTGLIASKTVALKFSHDGRKRKVLGEKSYSWGGAFKSLEQKDGRERKRRERQDQGGLW